MMNFKRVKKIYFGRYLEVFLNLLNKLNLNVIDKFLFKRNVFVVFLREDRIGHQAGNTEVEFYKAFQRKKNIKAKTIFIFPYPEFLVSNLYLRKNLVNFSKINFHKTIVINYLFFNKFFSKFIIQSIFKIFESCNNIYFASSDRGQRFNYPIIKTSKNHKNLCKEMGIDSKKYICITSRDNKYLNERYKNENWNYHNYRNSNIDNLKELSHYLSKEMGMAVVRIGSNPEKKIDWDSPSDAKIIDYSFSEFQSPKNDIDLISGCNLFINNGGGIVTAALAAKREIITINHIPIRLSTGDTWGLWIPKLIKRINDNELLSFRQIEELNLATALKEIDYINAGVETIENNGEDILNAFKDYFRIRNGLINAKEQKVINKYISMRNKTKHLFNKDILNNDKDVIAPSFLMKYPKLLD